MKPPQGVPSRATWNDELERFEHGETGPGGQRHGAWRAWDAPGVLRETSLWVDGLRHGITRRFDEGGGLREEGAFETDQPVGVWRSFDELGRLLEEAEYAQGVRHGTSRRFAADGALVDLSTWARGVREGVRRLGPVRGRYADDLPVGDWEYLGAHEVVLRTASVRVVDEAAALRSGEDPEALLAQSSKLLKSERVAEALLAAARAGGQTGDVSPFVGLLAGSALPFTRPDAEALSATYAEETPSVRALLAGLVMGLHAPTLLRALAARVAELGRPRVALELLNAAVLLTPRDEVTREARALALLRCWLPELVDADLPRLSAPARARVEGLRQLAGAPFTFAPARVVPPSRLEGEVPASLAQPLAAVREVLSQYAARLEAVRVALSGVAELPDVSHLAPAQAHAPPDDSHYAPARTDGSRLAPVAALPNDSRLAPASAPPNHARLVPGPALPNDSRLAPASALLDDSSLAPAPPDDSRLAPASARQDDSHHAPTSARRDDSRLCPARPDGSHLAPALLPEAALCLDGLDPLRLLELAQADWAALGWLCWAVGLDEVARPAALAPRRAFARAFAHCQARCLALELEAPTEPLAEARLRHELETLAMFRWLTKNGASSPWQEDLREP